MTEFTAADSFFDFDAATDNDLANEVGVEKPKAPCSFFRYPTDLHDQRPQPRSAMSFQPTQQVGQRAAIPDSSPTLAPLLSPEMQQQWPALSPRSQYTDTGLFTCGESTPPNQPILHYPQQQQQHEARPQPNVQQQEPASAPASQSMEPIRNTYEQPPARCILHTRMYQQDFGPSSMDPNLKPRPYTHQRPSASSSPITQHQHAPFPLNVEPQKLRPNHLLQRPTPLLQSRQRLPAGPSKESPPKTPPAPPPIQPHQQTANHTFPPTPERQQDPPTLSTQQQAPSPIPTPPTPPTATKPPIKGSKPSTGITKRPAKTASKPRGRPPKEAPSTGWVNATVAPEEHFNTTMYGRNSLRGVGSEARLAEPWNRPSVKCKGRAKGEEEEGGGESRSGEKEGVVIGKPTEQLSLEGRAAREGQGSDEGEVNEDVSAEEPAGERAAEPVQEAEMMEFDEDMFNLDIGNLDDMDAFLASLEGGSF
ncbi:hypothetical protein HO133_002585 [Letharia lupina]|uniref:Uncharacterized protein n=1 Tax=Letharia lupina TaxID=560253 RepID=A0A8H6CC98_9LECA|nr:uncharacterized protein HO133_002585 [Letharia lupina]KAF6220905.1 hypothetical protein HO133_002585 [Letharia lupina]